MILNLHLQKYRGKKPIQYIPIYWLVNIPIMVYDPSHQQIPPAGARDPFGAHGFSPPGAAPCAAAAANGARGLRATRSGGDAAAALSAADAGTDARDPAAGCGSEVWGLLNFKLLDMTRYYI